MIGTYASAALICLASLLVGRAIFTLAGRREWCWLEPAVGFARDHRGLRAPRPGARARHQRDARDRPPDRRRGGDRLAGARVRGAGRARGRREHRAGDRGRPLLPLRRLRALGPPRRRLQQRPRTAPRLGRVAAQRHRAGTGPRLPARPARPRRRHRRLPGHQPRPGVHRRDLRDRHAHRRHRARRAARNRHLAARDRRDPGDGLLHGRLLLRPGRLQGDRRGALRPRRRDLPDGPAGAAARRSGRGSAGRCPWSRSPAASSSVTRSPGSPGRSRSSSSGRRRSRPPGGRCARRGCCGSC